MGYETEASTETFDISSDTIELGLRQEPEMKSQGIEMSANELTVRLVGERIKQVTDPILRKVRRVEELCALLAGRTEMESARNSEASGPRRHNTSVNVSRNR